MYSSRTSWYDRYKDRRNGGLFFSLLATILGIVPAVGLLGFICQSLFPDYSEQIFVAAGVVAGVGVLWALARFCKAMVVVRRIAREKAQLSKLSSDELSKARSKLLRKQNRVSL